MKLPPFLPREFPGPVVTRFAPSPTGHLHAGHVLNAVYVWGLAGALEGRVLLRIENHDQGRYRREYEESILEDLEWLELKPDRGSVSEFRAGETTMRQSDNDAAYRAALDRLKKEFDVYHCNCSRKDLANRAARNSSSNPAGVQTAGVEIPYDGFCRARNRPDEPDANGMRPGLRLVLPETAIDFQDAYTGDLTQHPARQCGDLLLRDRRGDWTYQFAVVVDDMDQGVNLVVRGVDLLESTGRQILLGRMLGREKDAVFLHHPLLLEADGRKLSKRHGTPGIREARLAGTSSADFLGEVLARSGLRDTSAPFLPSALSGLFRGGNS